MTEQQIQLDLNKMRQTKVYLATPMYGGMCHGFYTRSLMQTTSTCMGQGLLMQIYYLFNESLITRARNYCVANFLKSDSDYLLFIDSDIGWRDMDLMYMWHLMVTEPDKYKIMTGLYPKKTIAWEKVIHAAKSGEYDNSPWELEKVAGDMVFNPLAGEYKDNRVPIFEPVKVSEGGTGFMMIHRSVFETLEKAMPERKYTPDHIREGEFAPGEQITAFFDCIINEQNRYLSEDYMFCEMARKNDIDVWTLPFIELQHCGSYVYQGNMVQMAQQGVHATVDGDYVEKLQKAAENRATKPTGK